MRKILNYDFYVGLTFIQNGESSSRLLLLLYCPTTKDFPKLKAGM